MRFKNNFALCLQCHVGTDDYLMFEGFNSIKEAEKYFITYYSYEFRDTFVFILKEHNSTKTIVKILGKYVNDLEWTKNKSIDEIKNYWFDYKNQSKERSYER